MAVPADVLRLLHLGAAVALSVSGGKDSQAAALAAWRALDWAGHAGPRLLIHSDLGVVEWNDSLPICEELAEALGANLAVVRRPAGGLMERWESRWESSRRRYASLETVRLVLPWSTPKLRFCTSELKTHVIIPELRRRFPGLPILNVTGIRRAESSARAKASALSMSAPASARHGELWDWRPIVDWSVDDVFATIRSNRLRAHPAYSTWGSTRVSCRFCIMGSLPDLVASAAHPDHAGLYRRMVALEARSTFAFQGGRWLGDIAPGLLDTGLRRALDRAQSAARIRTAAEEGIPPGVLLRRGVPERVPTRDEAQSLARIRAIVANLVDLPLEYASAESIRARYAHLMSVATTAQCRLNAGGADQLLLPM